MSQKKIINIFYFSGWIFWGLLLHPPIKLIFQFHGIRWIYLFVFSFFLSMLITPIVRKIAIFFSILDEPSCRKVHKDPTPLLGGLAVFISFVSSLLVNNILDRTVGFILLASSLIFIVGLIDDVRHLSAKLKLFIQIIGTLIVFMTGTKITLFPIHNVSEIIKHLSQTGNILLTFLWVIGITNAMNFLDGLDGLATGIGIVVSISLGIVAFQTEQFFLGWFAIAMAGSCLGFLPHNFNSKGPARIFLGDCGSTFIGFLLACLAIKGEWAANNALVSLCTPIMIFGILIFDMIHTTTSRIYTGKVKSFNDWVSFVGKDHIHHRLFRIFQNNKKTVFMILAINSCLSISAIAMRQLDALNINSFIVRACLLVKRALRVGI